jgi:hypothetical protein
MAILLHCNFNLFARLPERAYEGQALAAHISFHILPDLETYSHRR